MAEGETQTPISPQVKMVPESDLIAVKVGLEKKLGETKFEHESAIGGLNTQITELRQQVLQEQAAKEQLDTQVKSSMSKEDVEKVVAAKDAADKRSGELETQLLDLRRQSMSTAYRVPAETLKDKTTEQLDFMEIALKAVGVGQVTTKPYDLGGGGGSAEPSTPIERAKEVIAKAMERRGHMTESQKEVK